MRWLSRSVEELVADELVDGQGREVVHDAVVIGSGYGGAVAALRLAAAGVKVLVLERGAEYRSGEFPNDIGNAFGQVRVERDGSRNVNGYESGLYDLRIGDGISALVGNGLGGTSLINANVVIEPDPRVFDKTGPRRKPLWPMALRSVNGALPPDLTKAVATARAELEAEAPVTDFAKHRRLRDLENELRKAQASGAVQVSPAPITLTVAATKSQGRTDLPKVNFEACLKCGDCVTGCNFDAKKTLATTYLPRARRHGARLFTGASVLRVNRGPQGAWIVRFVSTPSRKDLRDGVENVPVYSLHARNVVLAAGTFGSTEILLRSATADETTGSPALGVSSRLGRRLSTNGDALGFGYLLADRVNGIGEGASVNGDQAKSVGPTITGGIRIDHARQVKRSLLVEDGAIPNAIATLFSEMIATTGAIAQLDRRRFIGQAPASTPPSRAVDWAALQPRAMSNTLTLLVMGHDPSHGRIRLTDLGRVRISYPKWSLRPLQALQENCLQKVEGLGGLYLPDPVTHPVPPGVNKILSGPSMSQGTITVHPLGGCCMGDTAEDGVVDDIGNVFDATGGTHAGLYVLDGSIVPTSLGANPLLTITALAERAMARIVPRITASGPKPPPADLELPKRPPADRNRFAREVSAQFTESMRSTDGTWKWVAHGTEVRADAHLLLHMPVPDLEVLASDGRHVITIPNQDGAVARDPERLPARFRLARHRADFDPAAAPHDELLTLRIEAGWVSILPVPEVGAWQGFFDRIRTLRTWWIVRGRDEIWRELRIRAGCMKPPAGDPDNVTFAERLRGLRKLSRHASENRIMEYRLQLRDAEPGAEGARHFVLLGRKDVGFAATAEALSAYCWNQPGGRPLARVNVWEAFGRLECRLLDDQGREVSAGVLQLDMLDMTRMHAPQLADLRDTPNALVGLAGYPLWFARLLIKTRLWDFRLPDYPETVPPQLDAREPPVPEVEAPTPWPVFPCLRVAPQADGTWTSIPADDRWRFSVPRSPLDQGADRSPVELRMIRYAQTPPAQRAGPDADGMVRCKVMLMLNGFAQSTLGFVPQEHVRRLQTHVCSPDVDCTRLPHDEPGLAEFFHEQGYDVWLFDYRTSSILDASRLPSTMDDIARFDIPGAVDVILNQLAIDEPRTPASNLQIFAFAHCVGAASFAMSLLGGHLRHHPAPGQAAGRDKIAGVTLSQMQAFLVGGKTSQMRLQVGGLLRDTLGIDYLRLSAAERKPSALESVLDRLFASLPVDPGEHCPHEFDRVEYRPGICTCKRMSGTISRLLKHDRIKEATHDRLPVYFGRANTSLLVHGGRCVENERLVNADGQDVYVTDRNIHEFLRMPVAVLHGHHNALFNVESAHRTHAQFARVNTDLAQAGAYRLIVARDYAHFDCTIGYGRDMQAQILNPLREFQSMAWSFQSPRQAPAQPSGLVDRTRARAPLAGPILGWCRTEQDGGKDRRVVRVWAEIDEMEAGPAIGVVTFPTDNGKAIPGMAPQLWPVIRVPLSTGPRHQFPVPLDPGYVPAAPYVSIALMDLVFDPAMAPAGARDFANVRVFSVHPLKHAPRAQPAPPGTALPPTPIGTPGLINDPVTKAEWEAAWQANAPRPVWPGSLGASAAPWMLPPATNPPANVPGAARIQPLVTLTPIEAQELWDAMMTERAQLRKNALQPQPLTLSRRMRHGALTENERPTAVHISRAVMTGPERGHGLSFVAACCRHPGLAFEDLRADASLRHVRDFVRESTPTPQFMFMLGDQIYADATAGLMDSPSDIERIALRHRKAFGTPAFTALTSSVPTCMVIDDHEIKDNWTRDLLQGPPGAGALFNAACESFAAYQWSHGPRNGARPGYNIHFTDGDVPFFVLDTRTQRERYTATPRMLHDVQLIDLLAWLTSFKPHDRRPKFIVSGGVFAPGLKAFDGGGSAQRDADTWQLAPEQRTGVLQTIRDARVRNVVFLSGDYHCAATATLDFDPDLQAFAIVTPPLYAQLPAANVKERQILEAETVQLPGSRVTILARACDGDGFASISCVPLANGNWRLDVEFHVSDWGSKAARMRPAAVRTFDLR